MRPDSPASPTDPRFRIQSVDIVRGFALFGVLLVNMYNFGAYADEWTGTLDRVFVGAMHGLFETKSWRLFSMLFGFGFFLQMQRADQQGSRFPVVYARRLVVLFLIGMGHALFYDGDILMKYAMLGVILVPFRHVPHRVLLALVVVLIAAFPIGNAYVSATNSFDRLDKEERLSLAERRDGHPYLGSIREVMDANAEAIPPELLSRLHSPESSLATFAMFLFGLYVGRRGILHDIPAHLPLIRRAATGGLAVGLLSMLSERVLSLQFGFAVFGDQAAPLGIQILGDALFAFGSTALSVGYAAGIIVLVQSARWAARLAPLGSVGRLGLTVYLSGTLMFGLLFYGVGFGQLFLLGPAETTAHAGVFFIIQMAFCASWTRYFRFGPAEWAWRSLTYLTVQPIRLRQ